jgi:hypothetical protein
MSYTLRNIFDYTENEIDTFLSNFVNNKNTYPLNVKRDMMFYYLIKNNYLQEDKYTKDPKYEEYILDSSTWEEFEKKYLENKFKEFLVNITKVNVAKKILNDNPELISYQNSKGDSLLIEASQRGNTEIVELLLATDQSHPEFRNNEGYTALMYASRYGHNEIVELLLATGQSHPEYQSKYRYTPLMLASIHGNVEIVKLLLATGQSHPEFINNFGETALIFASKYGYSDIVRLLLATGQSHPEYRNNNGETALMGACQYGHSEIVKLLLATGSSHPEFRNNDGKTALDISIENDHIEIIELLGGDQKQYEPIVGNYPSVKLITDESRFKIGCNSNGIEDEEVIDPISLEKIPPNLLVVAVSDETKTTCFNGEDLWAWWIVLAKGNPPVPANHPLTRQEFDAESISLLKELLDKNIE